MKRHKTQVPEILASRFFHISCLVCILALGGLYLYTQWELGRLAEQRPPALEKDQESVGEETVPDTREEMPRWQMEQAKRRAEQARIVEKWRARGEALGLFDEQDFGWFARLAEDAELRGIDPEKLWRVDELLGQCQGGKISFASYEEQAVAILTEGMDALTAAKYLEQYFPGVHEEQVKELANQAMRENPGDFETLFLWAKYLPYDPFGENPEQVIAYRKLVEMRPNSVDALYHLGNVLMWFSPAEALEMFKHTNKLKPQRGILLDMGFAYERLADYDAAMDVYSKAIEQRSQIEEAQGHPIHEHRLAKAFFEGLKAGTPRVPPLASTISDIGAAAKATETFARETLPHGPPETVDAPFETVGAAEIPPPPAPGFSEGERADIAQYLTEMNDAQYAELKQFLKAEIPELFEFLESSTVSLESTEIPETLNLPDARQGGVSDTSSPQAGLARSLQQLRADSPELAAQVERHLRRRMPKRQHPQERSNQ